MLLVIGLNDYYTVPPTASCLAITEGWRKPTDRQRDRRPIQVSITRDSTASSPSNSSSLERLRSGWPTSLIATFVRDLWAILCHAAFRISYFVDVLAPLLLYDMLLLLLLLLLTCSIYLSTILPLRTC